MKLRKITALLLCALMAAALFAGCSNNEKPGNTPSGETKYKEEIIIAIGDEFTTIDPMETTAESNQIVQDCTHDLLTDTSLDTMTNAPELAESWEMVAPDHWKVKLKANVKFHDGTILNTDDVLFTLQRAIDGGYGGPSSVVQAIKEIKKIDDLNFEVFLTKPNVDFNYVMASNTFAILSKEAFETMPPEEAVAIGTGPWKFKEFVSGDHVTLERFEECTLYPVPNTKLLTFRMIPEANARMVALENGEVDVIMSPNATDFSRLSETDGLQLLTGDARTQHFIAFNMKNKDSIVTDPKFRLAVAYGYDKDEAILAAWDGYARKSTSNMSRDVEYYADIEGIPYDPEKAKSLFEECGAVGKTISLVTSDADHRVKLAQNFQAQMAEYGITITIELMQNSALTELNTSDGTTSGVEITIASWTPGMNADYMYRNPLHSEGGRNYCQLADPEIDAMIDAALSELDKEKRAEKYLELQNKIVTEVICWIPIAQHTIAFGAVEGLTGARLHPGLVHQFKTVELKIEG